MTRPGICRPAAAADTAAGSAPVDQPQRRSDTSESAVVRAPSVLTVGYEKRQPHEMFELLRDVGVTQLFDVRLRPQSRRPGLSKTRLSAACEQLGIAYLHDARLGTPAEILAAYRRSGSYDWDAFSGYLATQRDALDTAAGCVEDHRTALLCYERRFEECHRRIVAESLADLTGLAVVHL